MAKSKRTKSNIFRIALICILIIIILASASTLIYTYCEQAKGEIEIQNTIRSWREAIMVYQNPETRPESSAEGSENATQVLPELWQAIQEYNQMLYQNGQDIQDAFSYEHEEFDLSEYGLEDGAFGVVSIPKINVEMPLYLGANYDNLAKGFAQLTTTSIPIGGVNTNSVIAGHRGWRGMAYMRDVEQVEIGDSVFVENPWETLEYRVTEIKLIEPSDTENIDIVPGKDLITIMTCHPYGVGSHRYLLICERYLPEEEPAIPTAAESGKWITKWVNHVVITTGDGAAFESSQATIFIDVYLPWICLVFSALILLILVVSILVSHKRKQNQNSDP